MATDITTEEFGHAVLQRSHEVPVIVDFWAEWCGPCRTLGPILEKVAAESPVELVKVDVDQNQELSQQFGVQGIPNVIGFRNGEPVTRFTGAIPEAQVREWVDNLLPSLADIATDRARDALLDSDNETAEAEFRSALQADPGHHDAATGLASLLIARGDNDDALTVLGKVQPSTDVARLQAAARVQGSGSDVAEFETALATNPSDHAARMALGKALAANAEYEAALDHLVAVVAAKVPQSEPARLAIVDVFDLMGSDHPLTLEYRRRLASALF